MKKQIGFFAILLAGFELSAHAQKPPVENLDQLRKSRPHCLAVV